MNVEFVGFVEFVEFVGFVAFICGLNLLLGSFTLDKM